MLHNFASVHETTAVGTAHLHRVQSLALGSRLHAVRRAIDDLAELVRLALAAEDVTAFADLLDPNVTWGAPGSRNPSCKSRQQVLAWYQRGREAGIRGSVFDVEVLGADRLLVSMNVKGTDDARQRGGTALRFQVFTIRDGQIADIVGFDDKSEALSYAPIAS